MSSQHQAKTPQPTPGHSCDYSQVAADDLVILTDNLMDTKREKAAEKAQRKVECKAKHEEAKRWKAEEERLEAEQRQREEEEAWRKKAVEEEAA
ncbi:hypothetical protein M404DRAFT_22718 [Pisolithus tinctorius Marx 270]|uniref:Uncharacterized protein n=1 Tax=Pisolithus tinctorius Marx 270 TaxID=870435 RepID=A0A0C3PKX1_PISTI|nr:hypothetical protein M404DRAFT_22718 [Pisolithus tinctorius Marx 270]